MAFRKMKAASRFGKGFSSRCTGLGPAFLVNGPDEVDENLLAFPTHDGVDPRRLAEDLILHEGRMDAAQNGDGVWMFFPRDLQQAFRLVDRGRDGRAADDIRLLAPQDGADLLFRKVIGYRIDEAEVGIARPLQGPREIGNPGWRPVAGNFSTAGVVIRVEQKNAVPP